MLPEETRPSWKRSRTSDATSHPHSSNSHSHLYSQLQSNSARPATDEFSSPSSATAAAASASATTVAHLHANSTPMPVRRLSPPVVAGAAEQDGQRGDGSGALLPPQPSPPPSLQQSQPQSQSQQPPQLPLTFDSSLASQLLRSFGAHRPEDLPRMVSDLQVTLDAVRANIAALSTSPGLAEKLEEAAASASASAASPPHFSSSAARSSLELECVRLTQQMDIIQSVARLMQMQTEAILR